MLIVSLIILQIIIFTVLISVFRRIMTQNVNSATKHLEELNQDYAEKEREVTKRLQEAEQKGQELINKAKDEAEKLKVDIIKRAESEKENIIQEARTHGEEIIQQADKSRQLLISELEERIAKEAINKACVLIEETLPEQFKQDAHAHWVEDLIKSGFSELERLHIPPDMQEARIISAFALNEEQKRGINKRLKDALGREIAVKEEVDPKVVAGLIITMGSLVLDGSLKNRIRQKAR